MSSSTAVAAVSVAPTVVRSSHASHALQLESLRALLPAPLPQAPGMPTGIDALDRALASSGLPRGRLTEVVGATGKLTLLHQMVQAAIARGEWVAYIDASRTLAPRDWAGLDVARLWIVRPPEAGKAAWCADVLLRSASFSLVVLDSAPPISHAVAVRLTGLARESNAAFVTVGTGDTTKLGGAVRLRVQRRRQRLRITIEKGCAVPEGRGERSSRLQNVVEVGGADGRSVARRLCSYPEVPDRRGAARAGNGGGRRGKGQRAATSTYGAKGGMLQTR